MNKIVLLGNGSPENGGCEAITKGTWTILKECCQPCSILDAYFNYDHTVKLIPTSEVNPINYPKRWSWKWWLLQFTLRFSDCLTGCLLFSSHKKAIQQADVVLSLGGDTYSLDYGVPQRFIAMDKYVKKQGTKMVIWGASIGPFTENPSFEQKIAKHFREDVDLILVREQVTKDYLQSLGVTENVHVVADPAFMMKPEDCSAKITLPSRYICINFSDLMAKYVTDGNLEDWISICVQTIDGLCEKFQYPMVFIPHVKSDFSFGNQVLSRCKHKSHVQMVPRELNAAEMKWIISRAVCNIACRTHSTIASFSTGVPTVSLGYSIKSKGLNIQMYGHEDYLVYQKNINPAAVCASVELMLNHLQEVKAHLAVKSQEIKKEACKAGELLANLIRK